MSSQIYLKPYHSFRRNIYVKLTIGPAPPNTRRPITTNGLLLTTGPSTSGPILPTTGPIIIRHSNRWADFTSTVARVKWRDDSQMTPIADKKKTPTWDGRPLSCYMPVRGIASGPQRWQSRIYSLKDRNLSGLL